MKLVFSFAVRGILLTVALGFKACQLGSLLLTGSHITTSATRRVYVMVDTVGTGDIGDICGDGLCHDHNASNDKSKSTNTSTTAMSNVLDNELVDMLVTNSSNPNVTVRPFETYTYIASDEATTNIPNIPNAPDGSVLVVLKRESDLQTVIALNAYLCMFEQYTQTHRCGYEHESEAECQTECQTETEWESVRPQLHVCVIQRDTATGVNTATATGGSYVYCYPHSLRRHVSISTISMVELENRVLDKLTRSISNMNPQQVVDRDWECLLD